MRHLFVDPSRLHCDPVVIDGPDYHHLVRVLRVREGDPLVLLDGSGCAWHAWVTTIDKRGVSARLVGPADAAPEPTLHITVAQAVGKGDRFAEALEHATEAGASTFIPLLTERTVVHLTPGDATAKLARWTAIVKGAAEQSGRSRVPRVLLPAPLGEVLCRATACDLAILLHPDGMPLTDALAGTWPCGGARSVVPSWGAIHAGDDEVVLSWGAGIHAGDGEVVPSADVVDVEAASRRLCSASRRLPSGTERPPWRSDGRTPLVPSPSHGPTVPPTVLLMVGPEGGFSPAEVERAHKTGALVVSLGPHVLRTETAALVAVSQLLFASSWCP